MTMPVAAILLPKHVHDWQTNHYCKARRSKNIEDLLRTRRCHPVVDEVRESVQQEILDQHAHDEDLIVHVAVRVECVA